MLSEGVNSVYSIISEAVVFVDSFAELIAWVLFKNKFQMGVQSIKIPFCLNIFIRS